MIVAVGHTPIRRAFLYVLVALTLWSIRSAVNSHEAGGFSIGQGFMAWGRPIAMTLGVLSVLIFGRWAPSGKRPGARDTVRHLISLHDEATQCAAFREGRRPIVPTDLTTEHGARCGLRSLRPGPCAGCRLISPLPGILPPFARR